MSDGLELRRAVETARISRNGHKIVVPVVIPYEDRIEALEDSLRLMTTRIADLEAKLHATNQVLALDMKLDAAMTLVACEVSRRTEIPVRDICSERRSGSSVLSRHIFCYLVRRHSGFSLPKIGKFLKRDHTTILYAIKKVEKLMKKNPELKLLVEEISAKITKES